MQPEGDIPSLRPGRQQQDRAAIALQQHVLQAVLAIAAVVLVGLVVIAVGPEGGELQRRIAPGEGEGGVVLGHLGKTQHRGLDRVLDPAALLLAAAPIEGGDGEVEIGPGQAEEPEGIDGIEFGILAIVGFGRLLSGIGEQEPLAVACANRQRGQLRQQALPFPSLGAADNIVAVATCKGQEWGMYVS